MFIKKIKLITLLFFAGIINCFSQYDYDGKELINPYNVKAEIKQITEKSYLKGKIVSLYDETGLLLQKCIYSHNGKLLQRLKHEYIITDTLLTIITEENNVNNDTSRIMIYKDYYTSFKQCYRKEIYSDSENLSVPVIIFDNFIYIDTLLQSYEWRRVPQVQEDIPDKILYRYDEKKRITQILRCSDFSKDTIVQKFMGLSTSKQYDFCNYKDTLFHIYIYNQDGQLTDCLIEHSCKKIYLLEWYVGTIQR